jgi:hypothetical protein
VSSPAPPAIVSFAVVPSTLRPATAGLPAGAVSWAKVAPETPGMKAVSPPPGPQVSTVPETPSRTAPAAVG